jgi:hypothetical protein
MNKISRVLPLLILIGFILSCAVSLAQAQTPTLIYSDSLAAPGESGNGFKIQYGGAMGTGSLAGNLVTLRITAPHGSTVSSIGDNLGDTYTLGVSADSGAGGWVTALYYLANASPGIKQITVTYTGSVADWHGAVMEYSGVAQTSPADGTCSNHSTTIQCSAAITTTGANDLVVASIIGLSTTILRNRMATVTPGGSFFLDAADTQDSDADEEYIQASAGSVMPSFTVTGNSESFNIVGMAFKAAAAGTNPTGMYILHEQHMQAPNSSSGSQNYYFVSSGNLELAAIELGSGDPYSFSGCSPSNTWTKKTEGTYWPQFFYLTSSASFSTNLHCTVGNSGGDNAIIVAYDVVGAATSPFDTLSSTQCQGNGGFVSCSITPGHWPGIMFTAANDGTGPVTQVGVSGTARALFDNTPYTGESDAGQLNNGDAWQHYFVNSTSAITYTWTMSNTGSYMQASGIVFDAGSGSSSSGPAPPTKLQATVQ